MKRFFRFFGLTVLVVAGAIALCSWYIDSYANPYLYNTVQSVPRNRVGLLLGTSKKLGDGRKNMYFYNRMEAAAALFFSRRVQYILVSGDNRTIYYNEPKEMRKELLRLGVPDTAIVLDHAGLSTFDSIIRSKKIFGQTSITVISQQFHNERAIFIARKNGIVAVGYNAKDVDSYNGFKTQVRELFARVKVFFDVYLPGQQPRHLGKKIPIPPPRTPHP